MKRAKPILAGGAAAIVLAGAMQLFPRFDDVTQVATPTSEEFELGLRAFDNLLDQPLTGDLSGLG